MEDGPPTTGDLRDDGRFMDADCLCPDWGPAPLLPAVAEVGPPGSGAKASKMEAEEEEDDEPGL